MLRSFIVFMLLLSIVPPTYSQEPSDQEKTISAFCEVEFDGLDIASLCTEYVTCDHGDCWENLTADLLWSCTDRECVHFVLMYANGVESCWQLYWISDEINLLEGTLCHWLVNGLKAHAAGDYIRATSQFEQIYDTHPHWGPASMAGASYMAGGDMKSAEDAFNRAVELQFLNPLSFYGRALLYLTLGNDEFARRDYQYAHTMINHRPRVQQALPILAFKEPEYEMQRWNVYPVYAHSSSPGGISVLDKTWLDAQTGELAFLDNGETLAIKNISNFEHWYRSMRHSTPDTFYLKKVSHGQYQLDMHFQRYPGQGLAPRGGTITVTFDNSQAIVYEQFNPTESSGEEYTLIQKPSMSAPFTALDQYRCGASPFIVMRQGDVGVNTSYGSLYLHNSPSFTTQASRQEFGQVQILDGPVCIENAAWWHVQAVESDVKGWIPEFDFYGGNTEQMIPGHYNILPVSLLDDNRETSLWYGGNNLSYEMFFSLATR